MKRLMSPAALTAAIVSGTLGTGALGQSPDPCEPQRVVSPATVGTTDFGLAVTTNGEQWFVGSSQAMTLCSGSPLSCSTGAVFVYDEVDGQLVHTQTIVPPDVELYDNFGTSLDVDGNRMVVGSPFTRRSGGDERAGAVFVYEHDGVRWAEVDRIQPPLDVTNEFGKMVELKGDTILVTPESSQRFFVYTHSGGNWDLRQVVQAPEPLLPMGAGYGLKWAISRNWFITSAYVDRAIIPNGGSLFV